MLIKRRFEIVGKLLERDPQSKAIFYEILRKHIQDEKKIEYLLSANYHTFIYFAGMSSCLTGINEIRERLNALDETSPYDNGLDYTHVNRVELLPSREGNAAVLAMMIDNADIKRIVQIIAVENVNDKIQLIRPWSIDNIEL